MEPDERARRIFEAFRVGDLAAIQGLVTPDVVVHMPGDNALAGEYSGFGSVLALVARAAVYIEPASVRLLDVDVNEGEIVAKVEAASGFLASGSGTLVLTQRMRFGDDGRISEAWVEPEDLEAWNALIGHPTDE
jgi:ketosteroid isomerase-like protein